MVGYFLLGLALTVAGLLLLYALPSANWQQIGRFVRLFSIGITGAFGLFGLFTGNLVWAILGLGAATAIGLLGRNAPGAGWWRSRTPGGSQVETAFLRMSLDHKTGAISGDVLDGRYQGRRIEDLGQHELIDLLAECRGADEQSVRLIEAYLDRVAPEWRRQTGDAPGGDGAAADPGGRMTPEEAYQVLGLEFGASKSDIRTAHRRLMQQHHPDHGGSTYFAAKINEAKDILLGTG